MSMAMAFNKTLVILNMIKIMSKGFSNTINNNLISE